MMRITPVIDKVSRLCYWRYLYVDVDDDKKTHRPVAAVKGGVSCFNEYLTIIPRSEGDLMLEIGRAANAAR